METRQGGQERQLRHWLH